MIVFFEHEDELDMALSQYIRSNIAEESDRQIWTENMHQNGTFVKEKTGGNLLEIDLLLKSEGSSLGEKWERYQIERKREMLLKFTDFCNLSIYEERLFQIFLMLVVLGYGIKDINPVILFRGLDREGYLRPGCFDGNLFYFKKADGTLHSLSPVARIVLNDVKEMIMCKEMFLLYSQAFLQDWTSNPRLNGYFYEKKIIALFRSNFKDSRFFINYHRLKSPSLADPDRSSFKDYVKEKDKVYINILKIVKFHSDGKDLPEEIENFIIASSGIVSPSEIGKPHDSILLITHGDTFPLIDFLILALDKTGGKHKLMMFQATVSIKTHYYVGTILSDVALRSDLCATFTPIMENSMMKLKNVETKYIWICEKFAKVVMKK